MILALGGRGGGDGVRDMSDPLFWGGIAILLIALVSSAAGGASGIAALHRWERGHRSR
jgi:hypothetical protein